MEILKNCEDFLDNGLARFSPEDVVFGALSTPSEFVSLDCESFSGVAEMIENLSIKAGVVREGAFADLQNLTEITFGRVATIENAIRSVPADQLQKIVIEKPLQFFDFETLKNQTNLQDISFPANDFQTEYRARSISPEKKYPDWNFDLWLKIIEHAPIMFKHMPHKYFEGSLQENSQTLERCMKAILEGEKKRQVGTAKKKETYREVHDRFLKILPEIKEKRDAERHPDFQYSKKSKSKTKEK